MDLDAAEFLTFMIACGYVIVFLAIPVMIAARVVRYVKDTVSGPPRPTRSRRR